MRVVGTGSTDHRSAWRTKLGLCLGLLLMAPSLWAAGIEVSTGGTGGTGTANTIPLWTDATTLANSLLTQSGGNVVLGTGKYVAPTGNFAYTFAGHESADGVGHASNVLVFTEGGSRQFAVSGAHLRARASGAFCWSSSSLPEGAACDTLLVRAAANTPAIRNGTTAQALRVQRTYTDDSNQAYGEITSAGTDLLFQGVNGGTGGLSQVIFGQAALPSLLRTSLATPGTPADGDWWVECTGTTPSRQCALAVRDGGVTYTVDIGGAH